MGRRPWGVLGCVMAACCPRVGWEQAASGLLPAVAAGCPHSVQSRRTAGKLPSGLLSCCCHPRC